MQSQFPGAVDLETKMALQGDGSESSDKGGGDEGMTIPFVATRK